MTSAKVTRWVSKKYSKVEISEVPSISCSFPLFVFEAATVVLSKGVCWLAMGLPCV